MKGIFMGKFKTHLLKICILVLIIGCNQRISKNEPIKNNSMQYKTFAFSPFQENTYVLYDETRECVVIDPGNFFPNEHEQLDNFFKDKDLNFSKIITTHNHLDHIFGASYLVENHSVKFGCHKNELPYVENFLNTCKGYGLNIEKDAPHPDFYFEDGEILTFGNTELKVILVPGHSAGGVAFYNEKEALLFCGDILFNGSIGRTDLPGGNHEQLISGIKEKLFVLPDETLVLSGHGPNTSIGAEKKSNPFLQ